MGLGTCDTAVNLTQTSQVPALHQALLKPFQLPSIARPSPCQFASHTLRCQLIVSNGGHISAHPPVVHSIEFVLNNFIILRPNTSSYKGRCWYCCCRWRLGTCRSSCHPAHPWRQCRRPRRW